MLGREIVYGQSTVYLCLSKYMGFENTHTHIATVASGTEGGTAVSCMESHMNRRPLGSIDPNSIRETELHSECRRRRERESLYSPQHDRDRDAARQRARYSFSLTCRVNNGQINYVRHFTTRRSQVENRVHVENRFPSVQIFITIHQPKSFLSP